MSNTNTEIKVTIAQKYDMVIEALAQMENTADLIEFIEDRKAKSVRKSGTKTEKPENEGIRNAILEYLGGVEKARIADVTKGVNEILGTDYTSNKVSAQMTKLKNEGTVVRTLDKKVAYFEVA